MGERAAAGRSPGSARHHHRGADADAVEEIDHVFVIHANAAVGGGRAAVGGGVWAVVWPKPVTWVITNAMVRRRNMEASKSSTMVAQYVSSKTVPALAVPPSAVVPINTPVFTRVTAE